MEQFTQPVKGQNDGQETAVPAAEQHGVTICLETHDAFCRGEEVAGVLRQVDSPYVKAVWDVGCIPDFCRGLIDQW